MPDYEIIQQDGKELRRYPDGTLTNARGRIVKLSAERSRAMQEKRRQITLMQTAAGIRDGTGSKSAAEGIRKIIAARANVALTDKGRAGNDAARLVLIAGSYYPENSVNVKGTIKHPVYAMPPSYYKARRELIDEGTIDAELFDDE